MQTLGTEQRASTEVGAETSLSTIDSERFGVVVARNALLLRDGLTRANHFCSLHSVDLLIVRCPTTDTTSLHAHEDDGFRVMDTLVYWKCAVAPGEHARVAQTERPFTLRALAPEDATAVGTIAAEAFRDYAGHYHADPLLAPAACTQSYVSWAMRCCSEPGVVDEMIGAVRGDEIIGFLALAHTPGGASDIRLTAVAPQAKGMGVLSAMIGRVVDDLRGRGIRDLEYSCLVTNIAAQKALARQGFWIDRSYHTLHKWFTRSPSHEGEAIAHRSRGEGPGI